jgi:hypothetical protein
MIRCKVDTQRGTTHRKDISFRAAQVRTERCGLSRTIRYFAGEKERLTFICLSNAVVLREGLKGTCMEIHVSRAEWLGQVHVERILCILCGAL